MSKQHYIGQYVFFIDQAYATAKYKKLNYPYLITEVDSEGPVFRGEEARLTEFVSLPERANDGLVRVERKIQPSDWVVVLDTPNVREFNVAGIGYTFQFIVSQDEVDKYYSGNLSCVAPNNRYYTNYKFGDLRLATQAEIDFQTGRIEASNPSELRSEPIRQEERIEVTEVPIAFAPQVGDVCKYLGDGLGSYLIKGNFYTIERYDRYWYFVGDTNPYSIDWFVGQRGTTPQFLKVVLNEVQATPLQIGDRVVCVEGNLEDAIRPGDNNGRGSGWGEGRIFTINDHYNEEATILWPTNSFDTIHGNGVFRWFVKRTNGIPILHPGKGPKQVITPVVKVNTIEDKIQWKPTNKDQKFTYLQEQLVRCILYKPESLRSYIAKSSNPGYAARFVKQLFPSRVGLEFDTAGRDNTIMSWLRQEQAKSSRFALNNLKQNKEYIWVDNSGDNSTSKEQANELRFSTTSVFQLKTLKELCTRLNQSTACDPCKDGGLHIHINIKDTLHINHDSVLRRKDEFKKYHQYIYKVFEIPKGTYEGTQIRDKNVFRRIKTNRNHPTCEWRLANTTFSYDKIVRWIIFCHLMTETLKKPNKKFNKALFEKIMLVE